VSSGEERSGLIADEVLLIRHSGEIPEVALYASLHFLGADNEGPRLQLTTEETSHLEQAALACYQEIILRDLDLRNRDRTLFRGLRRAHHNWNRFVRFCHKTGRSCGEFRLIAAEALVQYLRMELAEVRAGERTPSVNCSAATVRDLALAMDIDPAALPDGWDGLCEQMDDA